MASDLALALSSDLEKDDPLQQHAKLYLAKTEARWAMRDPEQGWRANKALEDLRELEMSKSATISLDAGREIANIQYFIRKDYWEAFSQLSKMFWSSQDNAGVVGQATYFSRTAPDPYRKAFRTMRKMKERESAPDEI